MNVEIVTVAAQFLFWEYLFQIFGIVSLQCARGQAERTRWIEMKRKNCRTPKLLHILMSSVIRKLKNKKILLRWAPRSL